MQASAIMRSHVVTLPGDATVRMAVDVFELHQQPVVPAVDAAGALLGVLPLRRTAERLLAEDAATLARFLASSVQSVLETECVVVKPTDTVEGLMQKLMNLDDDAALVVDGSRVVGLIGLPELCRAICSLTA